MRLARPLERLADELARLPGIGPKTAQRLAFYLMAVPREEAVQLARAIEEAREKVGPCSVCGCLTDEDPCRICSDKERDSSLLCLVEETRDVIAVDRTGFRGKYFVLNHSGSLMDGLDLNKIDINRLFTLIKERNVKEVIVATNPTIDGEVVARYIADSLRQQGIKVSKLAYGLPVGGDIEYIDEITLKRAIDGRQEL